MKEITQIISDLFKKWSGNAPAEITPLPSSGSYRRYFRCSSEASSALAAWNEDVRENKAFLVFTNHFRSLGLNVPEIYGITADLKCYLLEDLGDLTLHNFLFRQTLEISDVPDNRKVYEDILSELLKFQIIGNNGLDYSLSYPRSSFDAQSMQWDLNYFKYNFLKFTRVLFDEQKLEDDFRLFIEFLLKADTNYFMYRDFQSRNIMIHKNTPYFIDYQGGRKGALQYDLASILFESKTNLPDSLREHLLHFYINEAGKYLTINKEEFMHYYHGYSLMRILQALGAYGFRGLYEQKALFIQSIPTGIKNLSRIHETLKNTLELPELYQCFEQLYNIRELHLVPQNHTRLTIQIFSFSYKKQKPVDLSGNGGGFMFDCRNLPNPGRYPEYKTLTGKDKQVIDFLNQSREVDEFKDHTFAIVEQAIRNYQTRNFTSLMVSYGCTGGQHRSVYLAECLKKHLNHRYAVHVTIQHLELANDE